MMKLESEENNWEQPIVYPAKVLTLYKDSKGTLSSGKPRTYSVEVDSILHVTVAYESIQYPQQLIPEVKCIQSHQEHTVMMVQPRKEWAKLFWKVTKINCISYLWTVHQNVDGTIRWRMTSVL